MQERRQNFATVRFYFEKVHQTVSIFARRDRDMLKYLKIGLASLALSAFLIAPAVIVISADTAIAKNDNGKGGNSGGKGNSASKGSSNKGKSGSKSKSSSTKSGKSLSNKAGHTSGNKGIKSLGKKLKSGFGLFGTPKKKRKPTSSTAVVRAKAVPRDIKTFDDPSNLGKMNGAINSSAQSKLAHIQNGNFNGPVGIAAAYALANYDYDHAFADYEDAQALIEELEPLSDAYDYTANYDAAAEKLSRLDAEGADPNSEEYIIVAAAADADVYQSALDTIDEAEAVAIDDGTTVTEESVDALLAEASAVEEPDSIKLEEAENSLFALYKGDEQSLTDLEKELLIQSINLPSAEEIEEIMAGVEDGDESAELETDPAFEVEDISDEI